MASKFFTSSDHITKQLDDKHSITFRKLSYGERQRLISKCSKVNPFTNEAEIDFAAFALETFKARMVSWDGPEFKDFACVPDNIEKLEQEAATAMLELMGENLEDLDDDEKKE